MACRGDISRKPPVHLNQNMDLQDKLKPQRGSNLFEDGRGMRPPPEGVVARDYVQTAFKVQKDGLASYDDRFLKEDSAYWYGKDENGDFVDTLPKALKVDVDFVKRGQNRYNIYCSPCHGTTGYGNGLVKQVGKLAVPSYHDDVRRGQASGYIFNVISNGSLSQLMKGYKHQIPTEDRWAIVSYVRALQRSQYASQEDTLNNTDSKEAK